MYDMIKRGVFIVAMWVIGLSAYAHNAADSLQYRGTKHYNDSAVFQGMTLRLDLFNSVLEVARSKGALQTYEIGLNARLKQRFFPTAEMGYAFGQVPINGNTWDGQGGYLRLGVDINGLKKQANSPHALLVGIRLAGSCQQFSMSQTALTDPQWSHALETQIPSWDNVIRWDAWGEIVGGCQVQVVSGFVMGWYVRMKILMSRKYPEGQILPFYIPGFGYRNDTNWGFTYFIGWKL